MLRRRVCPLAMLAALAPRAVPARGARRTISVGPSRAVRTVAQAARLARDGDRIEVDAGDHAGAAAVWLQDDLEIVAIGGRAQLHASGAAAEDKALWVVRGGRVTIRGFGFSGAAVPDRNGAGLRFDAGHLRVRDCSFTHNEMGLLTSNDPSAVLEIENCEFAHNFRSDGHNHNLYAGRIARLSVTGSYLHHARTGHLLKSRAAVSDIRYNRLTDEEGGRASYELEFPNGGIARVVGNIVAQGAQTENPVLISFGAEGHVWPDDGLYLVNNTLIDRPGRPGVLLSVRSAAVRAYAVNNLLVGDEPDVAAAARLFGPGNVWVGRAAFERQSDRDFRLLPGSSLAGRLPVPHDALRDKNLAPEREYVHPSRTAALTSSAHNPGAMQTPGSTGR